MTNVTIEWISSEERLPEIWHYVLVCQAGDPESIHRTRLPGSIYRGWHNGYHGFDLEGSYWSELPEVPPRKAKERKE